MSTSSVAWIERLPNGALLRHQIDAVGNNLTARLMLCVPHLEPVWVFQDGSYACPHELVVGWNPDGHVLVPGLWEDQ